ncbi:hypothetical protein [Erysiphe necator associated tombus-like virus 9]|nr:hypothetical protein [Erysiphe necator associated tombus-like virus 9]
MVRDKRSKRQRTFIVRSTLSMVARVKQQLSFGAYRTGEERFEMTRTNAPSPAVFRRPSKTCSPRGSTSSSQTDISNRFEVLAVEEPMEYVEPVVLVHEVPDHPTPQRSPRQSPIRSLGGTPGGSMASLSSLPRSEEEVPAFVYANEDNPRAIVRVAVNAEVHDVPTGADERALGGVHPEPDDRLVDLPRDQLEQQWEEELLAEQRLDEENHRLGMQIQARIAREGLIAAREQAALEEENWQRYLGPPPEPPGEELRLLAAALQLQALEARAEPGMQRGERLPARPINVRMPEIRMVGGAPEPVDRIEWLRAELQMDAAVWRPAMDYAGPTHPENRDYEELNKKTLLVPDLVKRTVPRVKVLSTTAMEVEEGLYMELVQVAAFQPRTTGLLEKLKRRAQRWLSDRDCHLLTASEKTAILLRTVACAYVPSALEEELRAYLTSRQAAALIKVHNEFLSTMSSKWTDNLMARARQVLGLSS